MKTKNLSKNQKGFAVFEILFFVLLAIILVGAAYYVGKHSHSSSSASNKPTSKTASSSPITSTANDSSQVISETQATYAAYINLVDSNSTETDSQFIKTSGYYTSNYTETPTTQYPIFCDQNVIPASVSVTNPVVTGDTASVDVTKVIPGGTTWPSFTINLKKVNGKWLISGIDCTSYLQKAASIPQYQ
ncbi:MAG TPA: hypothetical protein VFN31_02345 [Candidatus Saccharimonadales bacterium]|nr:hypothetical protein [Candidatus Saccharimonadales bacterium]